MKLLTIWPEEWPRLSKKQQQHEIAVWDEEKDQQAARQKRWFFDVSSEYPEFLEVISEVRRKLEMCVVPFNVVSVQRWMLGISANRSVNHFGLKKYNRDGCVVVFVQISWVVFFLASFLSSLLVCLLACFFVFIACLRSSFLACLLSSFPACVLACFLTCFLSCLLSSFLKITVWCLFGLGGSGVPCGCFSVFRSKNAWGSFFLAFKASSDTFSGLADQGFGAGDSASLGTRVLATSWTSFRANGLLACLLACLLTCLLPDLLTYFSFFAHRTRFRTRRRTQTKKWNTSNTKTQ